jgi:hypothetical protein
VTLPHLCSLEPENAGRLGKLDIKADKNANLDGVATPQRQIYHLVLISRSARAEQAGAKDGGQERPKLHTYREGVWTAWGEDILLHEVPKIRWWDAWVGVIKPVR